MIIIVIVIFSHTRSQENVNFVNWKKNRRQWRNRLYTFPRPTRIQPNTFPRWSFYRQYLNRCCTSKRFRPPPSNQRRRIGHNPRCTRLLFGPRDVPRTIANTSCIDWNQQKRPDCSSDFALCTSSDTLATWRGNPSWEEVIAVNSS